MVAKLHDQMENYRAKTLPSMIALMQWRDSGVVVNYGYEHLRALS